MIEKEQCNRLFGIELPWAVTDVEIRHEEQMVKVHVSHDPGHELTCPQCGTVCKGYAHRPREWRHLDTCQYRTILAADVPRVECPEHGVVTVPVPWAEPLSRFPFPLLSAGPASSRRSPHRPAGCRSPVCIFPASFSRSRRT